MDLSPGPEEGEQEGGGVEKREPLQSRTGREKLMRQRMERVHQRTFQRLVRERIKCLVGE